MKVFAVFVCLAIGYSAAAPFGEEFADIYSNINKDIQDFLNLLPKDKIEAIVRRNIKESEEIANNWAYLTSDYAQNQASLIENSQEFKVVRGQLEGVSVNVVNLMNKLHNILGWAEATRGISTRDKDLRSMLMNEIKPIIPMTKIKALAVSKYVFSSAFRKLVSLATSQEFQNNVRAISGNRAVVDFENDARANGVDLDAVYEFAGSFSIIYSILEKTNRLYNH